MKRADSSLSLAEALARPLGTNDSGILPTVTSNRDRRRATSPRNGRKGGRPTVTSLLDLLSIEWQVAGLMQTGNCSERMACQEVAARYYRIDSGRPIPRALKVKRGDQLRKRIHRSRSRRPIYDSLADAISNISSVSPRSEESWDETKTRDFSSQL